MQRRIIRLSVFLLGLLSGAGFLYIFFSIAPTTIYHVSTVTIPVTYIAIFLLALALFSLVSSISRRILQGLLVSGVVCMFLLLHFLGITSWFFTLFLALLFVLLEVLLYQS